MKHPILVAVLACCFPTGTWAGLIADPVGDTFGVGLDQIDIISHSALSGGTARFLINFASAVLPASAGQPNSLFGFIDIDSDKDAATGTLPWTTIFSPPPSLLMGMDLYVDLGSEAAHPGTVDIFSSDNTFLLSGPITFSGSTVSLFFTLNGPKDTFNYSILVGTPFEPTDRSPNGDIPSESTFAPVPEPATFAPVALLLGWASLRRRHGPPAR